MSQRDALRLQALFAAAVELPNDVRDAMLARECAGDAELLAEIRELLDADARALGTTAQPIARDVMTLITPSAPSLSMSGMRVGAFELCEELGRGGMGAVYRAERVDGCVKQVVAIKFVRRELLDANTVRRFQLERQMMATLDHPSIARLLDASELADGTPYFVMQYVAGVPITDYCEREKLSVRERVVLLRRVCSAVAEAHRELIVHRDLKPANILIGADGAPTLLDFGIAKPLSAQAGAPASAETGTAQRYFSPMYAAPEQLTGTPVGVACDVYALGLLLYEILTGTRPFDFAQLSAGQIERLILDVPPPAPSVALARRGDRAARTRPRQLQGDLDGIVLRCLRKATHERYASVEQLEADLGNYLDGHPVQARGGHGWYRAQKFVRRNKALVAASVSASAAVLLGVFTFAWQARVAEQRASELEQVSKLQADMFQRVDPIQVGRLLGEDFRARFDTALIKEGVPDSERAVRLAALDRDWRVVSAADVAQDLIDRTFLKPSVEAVDAELKDNPVMGAAMKHSLAQRYMQLGKYDAALPLQQQVLATRRRVLGDEHPDTLASISDMGVILKFQAKLTEAEPYLREALQERRRLLGDDHAQTLDSISEFGVLLFQQGRVSEAEPYIREALERRRRVLGPEDERTLASAGTMAAMLKAQGKYDEAVPYVRQSLETLRRVAGEYDRKTLAAVDNATTLLILQGKSTEAEPYLRELLEKRRRLFGEEHPATLMSINRYGLVLQNLDNLSEAERFLRDGVGKGRRVLGELDPQMLTMVSNLGALLLLQGRHGEAEPYLREAFEKRRTVFGRNNPATLNSIIKLGALYSAQGRHAEAAKLLVAAEAQSRAAFTGTNAYQLAPLLIVLGQSRSALGELAAAESNLREAHTILIRTPAPDPHVLQDSARAMADLYAAWHEIEPNKGYGAKSSEWWRKLHAGERTALSLK